MDVAGSSPVVRPREIPRIAGLILAGGAARRMGGIDKPLLVLHGISLLDRIIARLRPQLACLALSANGDPARFEGFGLPVLADAVPDLGPLAGVLRGMAWAREQGCGALLTVTGDTPFIPSDLVSRLQPAPAVAASGGRVHHAVALWPVSCEAALDAWLRTDGRRSVSSFARTLAMREIVFPIVSSDPFFNINTPEDLRLAQTIAGMSRYSLSLDEDGTMDNERIWRFEESLWTADAEHYRASIDDECLMVLPAPPYVMSGRQAIEAVAATPRWSSIELSDRQVARPQEGLIVIAYTARAERDGVTPYNAHCTSTYRRLAHEEWRVIQHQQTPPLVSQA